MDSKRQTYKTLGRSEKMLSFSANISSNSSRALEECKNIRGIPQHPGREWRVLSTLEGFEDRACKKLSEQQIPVYFPRIRCREQQWEIGRSKAFFPQVIFAALNDVNQQELRHHLFIESIEEAKTPRKKATIQADINFMAFAERLNCFYPFKTTTCIPHPPVGGMPGRDFVELRNENECGYILLLAQGNIDQIFFQFESIARNICFETPRNVFVRILNLK